MIEVRCNCCGKLLVKIDPKTGQNPAIIEGKCKSGTISTFKIVEGKSITISMIRKRE